MAWLTQIPRKARLAIEFVATVGVVVVGLSANHEVIAYALGSAAALVLVLDLFGAAAWNALSAALVRTAVAQGVLAPQDPGAAERERQLRAALLHLLTEVNEIRSWVESAIKDGKYWPQFLDNSIFFAPMWSQHHVLVSQEQGFEALYETLSLAYREVTRVRIASKHATRPARVPKPEDRLDEAVEVLGGAEKDLRVAISRLGSSR